MPRGEIIDHTIAETVICVNRRMSYTNVKKILVDQDTDVIDGISEPLVPMFEQMSRTGSPFYAKSV